MAKFMVGSEKCYRDGAILEPGTIVELRDDEYPSVTFLNVDGSPLRPDQVHPNKKDLMETRNKQMGLVPTPAPKDVKPSKSDDKGGRSSDKSVL